MIPSMKRDSGSNIGYINENITVLHLQYQLVSLLPQNSILTITVTLNSLKNTEIHLLTSPSLLPPSSKCQSFTKAKELLRCGNLGEKQNGQLEALPSHPKIL